MWKIVYLFFVLYVCKSILGEQSILVETNSGRVLGYAIENLHVWKNIPYANAPTGNLRWKPPQVTPRYFPEISKILVASKSFNILRNELNGKNTVLQLLGDRNVHH